MNISREEINAAILEQDKMFGAAPHLAMKYILEAAYTVRRARKQAKRERQPKPNQDDVLKYATSLAVSLCGKHYSDDAKDWKPLPDIYGVLTQIDNMTTGLTREHQRKERDKQVQDNRAPLTILPIEPDETFSGVTG